MHDRRGLALDPRWPAVVLQLATLSGRLCELLSIASTVVTATKSLRRTSRWKLLFLLPVFVFGFRLLPVDLNKQRLNMQHFNRHLNTDLNKQHLDLNKQRHYSGGEVAVKIPRSQGYAGSHCHCVRGCG